MKRFLNQNLTHLLEDRSTLYSGSRSVRADLVRRSLLAAHEIEIGLASDIEEDIFLLMHRIAEADERDAGLIE